VQAKYNLYNLVLQADANSGITRSTEIQRFQLLLNAIGVSPDVANTIAAGMRSSWSATQALKDQPGQADSTGSVLMPIQVSDLVWYGIDPKVVKQIEPFVQIVPFPGNTPMTINANTAVAEVLMAGCPAMTRAQAEQVILQRRQKPYTDPLTVPTSVNVPRASGCTIGPEGNQVNGILAVTSQYFEIYGQLRYELHVIRERSIVYRKDQFTPVQVLRRERIPPDAT